MIHFTSFYFSQTVCPIYVQLKIQTEWHLLRFFMKFIGKACIQLNRNERVSTSKNIRIKSQLCPSRYLCIRIIDMHHLFGFQFVVDFNDCSWKFAKVFDSIIIDVPNFIQKFSNKFLFDDVFCYDRSVYEFFYCDSKEFGKNVPFLTIIWQTWLFLENIEILGIEPILFYSNVIQERHIILVHNEFVLFFSATDYLGSDSSLKAKYFSPIFGIRFMFWSILQADTAKRIFFGFF